MTAVVTLELLLVAAFVGVTIAAPSIITCFLWIKWSCRRLLSADAELRELQGVIVSMGAQLQSRQNQQEIDGDDESAFPDR